MVIQACQGSPSGIPLRQVNIGEADPIEGGDKRDNMNIVLTRPHTVLLQAAVTGLRKLRTFFPYYIVTRYKSKLILSFSTSVRQRKTNQTNQKSGWRSEWFLFVYHYKT